MGQPLTLDEYYLWRKNSHIRYPWDRSYGQQFLKFEQKRISECFDWINKIRKAKIYEKLEEISFYVIPVHLSLSCKASIAEKGEFNYVGLTALVNSHQNSIVGLLPQYEKKPQDYKLIRINKSKKTFIKMKRLNLCDNCVIIEDWEYLDSDFIYNDVSFEKRIVSKILSENLVNDDGLSLSLQSPIMSAPHNGFSGGIALSSIAGSSAFARELVKIIHLMVPPEYRMILPLKSVYKGKKIKYSPGITFHYAERIYRSNNVLSSFYSRKYGSLSRELIKRNNYNGEFSIFSTLYTPDGGTGAWKSLLRNFTKTEVTIPENLDNLMKADVYLKPLKNSINEDLWLQVVYSRQFQPSMNDGLKDKLDEIIRKLRISFDILLSEYHKNEISRDYLVRLLLDPIRINLIKIAQSFARSEEKNDIHLIDLQNAYRLILDNFKGFTEHPEFDRIRERLEISRANERFDLVQTALIYSGKCSIKEIYEAVETTRKFRDLYDLQGLLDWMKKKGYVILDRNNKYDWL